MEIRNYRTEDYPEICEIDKYLFENMGGYVLFRHIEELFSNFFFVAVESGKIIGYILGGVHFDNPDTGKLIRIGVVKEYRKKGCGEKLTSTLLEKMKECGVKKVHLTVAETNTDAISFYKKIGFTEKMCNEKYFYPDIPRLIFEKEI